MRYPANPPAWLQTLNGYTRDTAFFLFGGKAYAVFALMFGLSFFLIIDGAARRGVDLRWRFLWRLGVLAIIGYGRMSLTCYITQALVGAPVFYHYGLGLFRQLGPFYSILYGAAFFLVQCAAAHWWIKRFRYGPVEWLWRCATLLTFKVPLRRREDAPTAEANTPSGSSPEIARV